MANDLPANEALLNAVSNNLESVANALDAGADPNADNGSPLLLATMKPHVQSMRLLLERGADVGIDDAVALRSAASRQPPHPEALNLLFAHGGDRHVPQAMARMKRSGDEREAETLLALFQQWLRSHVADAVATPSSNSRPDETPSSGLGL